MEFGNKSLNKVMKHIMLVRVRQERDSTPNLVEFSQREYLEICEQGLRKPKRDGAIQ